VIYLDAQGNVLRMTAKARTMLDSRDGIAEDHGTLRTIAPTEQKTLDSLIANAAAAAVGCAVERPVRVSTKRVPEVAHLRLRTPAFGGTMRISRMLPRSPFTLLAAPFVRLEELSSRRPAVVLVFVDPDSQPRSRSTVLRAAYGLSPSECRITELLAAGHTISDIADRSGRTVGGTRFQLKSIFRKTGTHRQTELVKLYFAIPALED